MFPYCCFLEKFFEGYFDRIGECVQNHQEFDQQLCVLCLFLNGNPIISLYDSWLKPML